MSLRVLDDDRPGFALLLFSARLDRPTLSLSIRSTRENAFLGPDGKWQRDPHYFTAERVRDNARGTEYRVGPEIVNYLLEHDQILVAGEDGKLNEETRWENAIPQVPGSGAGRSIYRASASVIGTETKAVLNAEADTPAKVEPPAEPATPSPTPSPPRIEAPPAPTPIREIKPGPEPVPPSKSTWLRFLPLAAIPVVLIALLAVPQLRCGLFGVSCPAPKDLLTPAMACAAEREVSSPCDIKACFDSYLAATAPRDVALKASTVIEHADQACRKDAQDRAIKAAEADALQSARQCVGGAGVCRAASCYGGYMARYGSTGVFHDAARRELEALKARCPPPAAPQPPAPQPPVRPPDDRLTIPRNLDDLNGCWQSVRGDIQFVTDDAERRPVGKVRVCYCLGSNGVGYAKYKYSDGTQCVGALRAQLSQDRLFISHPRINCTGNPAISYVVGVDVVCSNRPGEDSASCDTDSHFRSPTTTKDEKFRRVSQEYCN
jgi:hypothetical protein